MARKVMPKIKAPEAAPVGVLKPAVADVASLAARLSEVEGDLLRLAKLCGKVWGEPLASEAVAIASKRQGA